MRALRTQYQTQNGSRTKINRKNKFILWVEYTVFGSQIQNNRKKKYFLGYLVAKTKILLNINCVFFAKYSCLHGMSSVGFTSRTKIEVWHSADIIMISTRWWSAPRLTEHLGAKERTAVGVRACAQLLKSTPAAI